MCSTVRGFCLEVGCKNFAVMNGALPTSKLKVGHKSMHVHVPCDYCGQERQQRTLTWNNVDWYLAPFWTDMPLKSDFYKCHKYSVGYSVINASSQICMIYKYFLLKRVSKKEWKLQVHTRLNVVQVKLTTS